VVKKRCHKKPFGTEAEGKAAIHAMAEKYGSIVYKRVNRYGNCKAFHITSTPTRGRRKQW
jgi:hypothetical protein